MSRDEYLYALQTLSQWCRGHGIYEVREALTQAVQLAAKAHSAEDVAEALEHIKP